MANQIFITGASAGSISGGSNVVLDAELDKRRHAKIFIHFAKMFVERFPKWESSVWWACRMDRTTKGTWTSLTQDFYGWALGIEDVAEWMTL